MNSEGLLQLLKSVAAGAVVPEAAAARLQTEPLRRLDSQVCLDSHRAMRTGFAEIVYTAGKTDGQLRTIAQGLRSCDEPCLFSRCSEMQARVLAEFLPHLDYDPLSRLAGINRPVPDCSGLVVVAAGSSDLPVAEEAARTAEYMAVEVKRLYDVGVAGLHRLLAHAEELVGAKAVVVIAGMEGALASVVTGMVGCPVYGVPTSVGYGAGFGGVSALLSMLNSCATGLSVMNIDNGLGGGYCGALVVRRSR